MEGLKLKAKDYGLVGRPESGYYVKVQLIPLLLLYETIATAEAGF